MPPDALAGRETELAALRDPAVHGRFSLLFGPRRYGKTSLVGRLAADAERDRELAVVVADLQGVLTLDDISRRLAAAYRGRARSAVADTLVRVLAGVGDAMLRTAGRRAGLSLGDGLIRPDTHPPAAALEELLEVPWEAAGRTGVRILVVLDEFQAVADVHRADAVLRSKIQHQRERVSYLFSAPSRACCRRSSLRAPRRCSARPSASSLGRCPPTWPPSTSPAVSRRPVAEWAGPCTRWWRGGRATRNG